MQVKWLWYSHNSDFLSTWTHRIPWIWQPSQPDTEPLKTWATAKEGGRADNIQHFDFTEQAQPSECSELFIHVNGTNENAKFQRHLWPESNHKCNKPYKITEKTTRFWDVSTKAQTARRQCCYTLSGGSIKLYLHLQITVYCLIFFSWLEMLCQVNIAMNDNLFQSQSFKKSC